MTKEEIKTNLEDCQQSLQDALKANSANKEFALYWEIRAARELLFSIEQTLSLHPVWNKKNQ